MTTDHLAERRSRGIVEMCNCFFSPLTALPRRSGSLAEIGPTFVRDEADGRTGGVRTLMAARLSRLPRICCLASQSRSNDSRALTFAM